jgi:hypothetical protein
VRGGQVARLGGQADRSAQKAVCTEFHVVDCQRESLPHDEATHKFDAAAAAVCRPDLAELRAKPRNALRRVDCSSIGFTRYPDYRRRFDPAIDYGQVFLIGINVKGNREEFKHADPTTLVESKEEHRGASVALSVGAVVADVAYASLTHEFQRSFSGGSTTEICSPLGTMGSLQCKSIALGAPKKKQASLVHLEFRRFFSEYAATAFRVHYDFDEAVFGFELPLYFLRNKDGGLAGGITAAFRSDEDAPTLSVFISETFTLAP